jgi:hypothetical protein
MTTTWTSFLSELRLELSDTNESNPRYSNELLREFTRDGILDYSQFFPRYVLEEKLERVDGATRSFCLPVEVMGVDDVQCPLNTHLQPRSERPGLRVSISNKLLFYWMDSLYLYLNADPGEGEDVHLSYYAPHPYPTSADPITEPVEGVTDFTFSIPGADMELIKLFAMGKVQIKVRGDQARLDRFKITSGTREDNPMIFEGNDYMERYHEGITRRTRGGMIQLFRPRRFIRTNLIRRYPY